MIDMRRKNAKTCRSRLGGSNVYSCASSRSLLAWTTTSLAEKMLVIFFVLFCSPSRLNLNDARLNENHFSIDIVVCMWTRPTWICISRFDCDCGRTKIRDLAAFPLSLRVLVQCIMRRLWRLSAWTRDCERSLLWSSSCCCGKFFLESSSLPLKRRFLFKI